MGDYPDMFERLLAGRGLTFRRFHVENDGISRRRQDCDGWLITGSRHGAYEDHPFIKPLEAFIRAPMPNMCRWSASALATRSSRRRWAARSNAMRAAGPSARPPMISTARHFHPERLAPRSGGEGPEAATVMASSDFCQNAALLYDDRMF
jgi:GMP synthase-like glutamine amidotransferase